MGRTYQVCIGLVAASIAGTALAAVSAEEAKQLGGNALTVVGAEKAGNKDGTIPEYTGQPITPPANYDPKIKGYYPEPWSEKPLFTITAQNYQQYADKLDGMVAMFKQYPNYRMDIYPSHRNWILPKYYLENTVKNATSCKGSDNELKLEGCYGGVPFPIPKTGNQVMWNHLVQYEAVHDVSTNDNYIVSSSGGFVLNSIALTYQSVPMFEPGGTGQQASDVTYWSARVDDQAPARRVGSKLVVVDSLDSVGIGRRAWQYIPGQRRVKLAPDLAYDTPSPFSGGSATMDDQKVFLGALDRFEFKLKGKKEKFISYNNFRLTDKGVCPTEKVATKNFPNPDCIRWELHRVWVVEATLKPNFRHIYKRRVFFFDEDAPGTGVGENYDASGRLYHLIVGGNYPFFNETGGISGSLSYQLDMQTGAWAFAGGLTCKTCEGWHPIPNPGKNFYSPEALSGEGIR